jgi:hypothetical protein
MYLRSDTTPPAEGVGQSAAESRDALAPQEGGGLMGDKPIYERRMQIREKALCDRGPCGG